MKLRFHLSPCNHGSKLKDVCSKILHKASTGIRDEIIKALEKEIRTLKTKRNHNCSNIRNLEKPKKISLDNIQPTRSVRKRNRRFKKNVIVMKEKKNVKGIDLRKNISSKK